MHKFQTFLAGVSLTLLLALISCSLIYRMFPDFSAADLLRTFFPLASMILLLLAGSLLTIHVLFYSHPYPEIQILAAGSAIVGLLGATGRIETVSTAAGFVVAVIVITVTLWTVAASVRGKLKKTDNRGVEIFFVLLKTAGKAIFYGFGFCLLALALVCAFQAFLLARDGMYQLMSLVGILASVIAGLALLILRPLFDLILEKRKGSVKNKPHGPESTTQ